MDFSRGLHSLPFKAFSWKWKKFPDNLIVLYCWNSATQDTPLLPGWGEWRCRNWKKNCHKKCWAAGFGRPSVLSGFEHLPGNHSKDYIMKQRQKVNSSKHNGIYKCWPILEWPCGQFYVWCVFAEIELWVSSCTLTDEEEEEEEEEGGEGGVFANASWGEGEGVLYQGESPIAP